MFTPPQVDRSLIKNVLAIYQEVGRCSGWLAPPPVFSTGRSGLPGRCSAKQVQDSTGEVQAAVSITSMSPHCGAVEQVGMGQMDCYEHDFEEPMLKDTADYYRRKAAVWVQVKWCGGGVLFCWRLSQQSVGITGAAGR